MTNNVLVFLSAMAPISELRGAIPLGIALGMPPFKVFFISIIGNILPIPFLIIFSRPVIQFFKRFAIFEKILTSIEQNATKKAYKIKGYIALGLYLLVAAPLPGTGAWTGSLIAAVLNLRLKYAIPIICAGVLTAGVIVLILSFGTIHLFGI
ncbi:MAG: small multi-drug export protein [Firmicutes bacterium]|nr:small multi-drug export protein [Bacillota bacterium]